MPRLLVALPCERVILEQETNDVSLIAIMQDIAVPVVENQPIPVGAALPTQWHVFTLWDRSKDDVDDDVFEQRISLRVPDKNIPVPVETIAPFQFGNYTRIRINIPILGFPVYAAGICYLGIELRKLGAEHFASFAEFPLTVIHRQVRADDEPVPVTQPIG